MDSTAAGHCLRGFASRVVRVFALCLGLATFAGVSAAVPAPAGTPFFTRYTSADYPTAPKHLAVAAAPDGRVWVGNVEGVLRFAGGRFDLVRLPGAAPGRSLALGPDGRVYVGSYDHFGFLEDAPDGSTTFVDLRARFGGATERFPGEVWDIAVAGDAVYFQTDRRLYALRDDGGTEVLVAGHPLRSVFAVGSQVYCRLDGVGLTRVEGSRFVPVPGGARFAHEGIYDLRRWDGDALLLMTRAGRFYRADTDGIRAIAPHTRTLFDRDSAYEAVELGDGSLAVATLGGEVVRLDRALRPIGRFRAGHYPIMQLARDREGGLWIATQGDLVRAQWPSPWSYYAGGDGLAGSLQDTLWHQGARWVASTTGLLVGRPDARGGMRYTPVPGFAGETWSVAPDGDGLLVVARSGISRLAGDTTTAIAGPPDPWTWWPSRVHADRAFVPYEPGLALYRRGDAGWRLALRHESEGLTVGSLVEDGPDTLWLGNWRGAPVRLALAPDGTRVLAEHRLGAAHGLPEVGDGVSHVLALGGTAQVVIAGRFHAWNGERFEPSDADGLAGRVQRPDELQAIVADDGTRYAWTTRELFARRPDDAQWRDLHPDAGPADGYTELDADADGTLAIAGWTALLRYDPRIAPAAPALLRARIAAVTSRTPDGNEQRRALDSAGPLALTAQHALRVEFALDTASQQVEFRSRLLGLESEFGPWSATSRREFAALAPGDYTLEVEARAGAAASEPARLPIRIAPDWWQNPWLALGAAAVALLLAAFWGRRLASHRVQRVQARNARLEALIGDRTRELAEANTRLQRLAVLDGLTGVANRRGFDAALARRYADACEAGTQLALLMIDVDHFKQYNDRHGHLAGDEALREIAQEIAKLVRGDDMLARFGGEEFALILPGAGLAQALLRAEEIRSHCATRALARGDGLSVSIGVAASVPRAGLDARELIEVADAALYQAKRGGRNRVEAAPS
jgi:diguanylate cyclase (GGDEF)-like protein